MELLLQYAWKHKIFPLKTLETMTGEPVEVIDPGLSNMHSGPDFFNAKLKINGTLWVGNVEVHRLASDWYRHGHDKDKVYDSVVLHVCGKVDCEIARSNGEKVPQLALTLPDAMRQHYEELRRADIYPPCYSILSSIPKLVVHSWLTALQAERFEQKTTAITERLKRYAGHWEDAFFLTLARNFGFGLNGDAFEAWGTLIPFRAVDKHRDDLFQVEAIFFGLAGLLEETCTDAYYLRLQKEYRYLNRKFTFPAAMDASRWRFLRLRPGNFPHVRLAQLAYLYHHESSLFSRVMEAETIDEIRKIFTAHTSTYWESHYHFEKDSAQSEKVLSDASKNLLVINTVVPFLYAYGQHKGDLRMCERAARFLEELKAENNHVTRLWSNVGLPVFTAADSQALLQLQREYCERKKCLYCRFGYEYLRRK